MNSKYIFLLCIVIVFSNIIISNQLAPTGIFFTPVVIGGIAAIIGLTNNDILPVTKSILLSGFTILHDIGIKLYSGGSHDLEGLGFVHLFLIIGFILAIIILTISIAGEENMNWKDKLIAVMIFPATLSIYLFFFHDLGLGRIYPI